MLNLEELRLLAAFSELGTLTRVAEAAHISTPSVTRAMQHLEECFGVPLFTRGKNKIELNDTGAQAAEMGKRLLREAETTVNAVREFDRRQKTIVIRSCAPAPLWELQRKWDLQRPGMMLSSAICQNEEILNAWQERSCDIAILPFPIEGAKPFMQENLFVCVPPDHELAMERQLTFGDINGFNFLLRTELGFWDTMCREKMPASKFLVQTDYGVFDELVRASSLPCFTTDYSGFRDYPSRVNIPIADSEAHVTFYIAQRKEAKK